MTIDINAFVGKWPYWPVAVSQPAEMVAELERYGIERAAVCSTRGVFVNCEDGNRETESAAREYPERLAPFACVGTSECSPDTICEPLDVAGLTARGFRGVRLYPQHHSYDLLREPFVGELCEEAAARSWPVLLPLRLVMNWGMPILDLASVAGIVERHGRVTWILAGINYLHELRLAVDLMRRHRRVHLETSCVMGYQATARLVELCGAERILFGSGMPLQHAGAGLSKIVHARIPDAAKHAILGENARRLLD